MWLATSTGSMPASGRAPCAPLPVIAMSKNAPPAIIAPSRIWNLPTASPGRLCMPKIDVAREFVEQPVLDHRLGAAQTLLGQATMLALRKEAAGYPEALAAVRTEANVREIVEDYNRRVLADRLRPGFGLPPCSPKRLTSTRWSPLAVAARRGGGARAPGSRGAGRSAARRARGAPSRRTALLVVTGSSPRG